MRNPWGKDWGYYRGPWHDKSNRWTAEYMAQVPYADENDGIFFIEDIDFVYAFYMIVVSYYDNNK
jgi:hypothetical protein